MRFPCNIIEDQELPEGTILLIPPVSRTHVTYFQTRKTEEFLEFDPRQSAAIKNATSNFDVETKK